MEGRRGENNGSYRKRFFSPFYEAWILYKESQNVSRHSIAYSIRDQLKVYGLYPNTEELRKPWRKALKYYLICAFIVSVASLFYGVHESLGDVVNMGRDVVFIIATCFTFFRMMFFVIYANDVDEIIDALEEIFQHERKGPGCEEVRTIKRWHFILLMFLLTAWLISISALNLIKISTPFWMKSQTLPFHVAFPFQLHNPSKHPISHGIIFASQSTMMIYILLWLGFAETLCWALFSELTSAMKVLCIELRNIHGFCDGDEMLLAREVTRMSRFHQQIIFISTRCNHIFHTSLIFQMIVNFLLVSLSVFEVMVARSDLKVLAEYSVIMLMTMGHLSFWSKFGDMLSYESMQVAYAAYEAYDPRFGSKSINQNLRFIMNRAQTPLIISASPLPPFNLMNYMAILKQCYSILTLLMQTLE